MSQDETAVKDEVVADATAAESAPVENLESEVAEEDVDTSGYDDPDGTPERLKTDDEAEEADETDEPAEAEETEAQEQPQDGEKPLSPKAENRFQQLANERNQLKAELEALRAREAQFAQEQNLINEVNPETGEYYTPQEIERIAWQQSREQQAQQVAQERYNLEVQQNQQTIDSELARAYQEFPELDPSSNSPLALQATERVVKALVRSEDGTVVGAYDSPYEILKTIAEATKANAAQYEAKAQKATEKMLANVDPGSAATQAKAKSADDELFAAYDEAI
jgi:vacuolar-type H+-ATPase subunit I/STV1